MNSPIWTVPEIATYVRVSERTVRRWIAAGELDHYRINGTRFGAVRVTDEALHDLLSRLERRATVNERRGPGRPRATRTSDQS